MAIESDAGIEIACPAEEVFAFLADVSQGPRWLPTCGALEKLTPGPDRVGTQLRYTYRDESRSIVMPGQIVGYQPSNLLAFEYGGDLVNATAEFHLEPTVRGTQVAYKLRIIPQTFLVGLASPLIRRQAVHEAKVALERLRELLEAR